MIARAAFVLLSLAAAAAGASPTKPDSEREGGSTVVGAADAGVASKPSGPPLLPLPPIHEAGPVAQDAVPLSSDLSGAPGAGAAASAAKRGKGKGKGGKTGRSSFSDVILESQNQLQSVARRYAQLLMSRRFDEARQLHEEELGRRPDWNSLRNAASAFLDVHGAPRSVDQHLVTYTGSELTTFYFTAVFADASELPIRVAVDHWGHVSGAGVGGEIIAATKKRYDRFDQYKPKTTLMLPFHGTWMASNATLAPGNGHYLNANQRFAVDFFIVDETEPGKRKSHVGSGRQNLEYFSFGQDVLAPADAVVVQVVDGVQDNSPGITDVYYRLGNSIVLSFENGEYAHLCHLMMGSSRVRPGDRVQRGQVLAKCGNSGNSTGPHLHFQLTDGPQISHAASLPAYFRNVRKGGTILQEVLPQSGDRLENADEGSEKRLRAATP